MFDSCSGGTSGGIGGASLRSSAASMKAILPLQQSCFGANVAGIFG